MQMPLLSAHRDRKQILGRLLNWTAGAPATAVRGASPVSKLPVEIGKIAPIALIHCCLCCVVLNNPI